MDLRRLCSRCAAHEGRGAAGKERRGWEGEARLGRRGEAGKERRGWEGEAGRKPSAACRRPHRPFRRRQLRSGDEVGIRAGRRGQTCGVHLECCRLMLNFVNRQLRQPVRDREGGRSGGGGSGPVHLWPPLEQGRQARLDISQSLSAPLRPTPRGRPSSEYLASFRSKYKPTAIIFSAFWSVH